jgi:ABC-type amino acid transport substrate-binding protein/heat shock protein HslJ
MQNWLACLGHASQFRRNKERNKMSRTLQIVLLGLLALALVIVGCLAGYLIVKSLIGGDAKETPTVIFPTAPAEDTSWQRVQAAGKIVVGTSADYPPFEYMANDTQIDGFDVALMDDLGRRLGVEVDYRNFAFDGLFGALQVGQVDAAIAAISVTPEREASVDFTTVYFVGEDGILAADASPIASVDSVSQMASYLVGVQEGSVYQAWLRRVLVDTGQMPEGNLKSYERIDDAVGDLLQGRLDLVVLDLQPAESFVADGGLNLVSRGLNIQHYAIALPKGAQSLKAELDRGLAEMYSDGTISRLAKLYLNLQLGDLLPTPTPASTSTPGPAPVCVDALELVQHVDTPDDPVANPPQRNPGQSFTKVWRVRNTGTCTWNSSYQLVYATGNSPAAIMGGQPAAVQGQVAPGGTYDAQVNLIAPQQPGTYIGYWQMENGRGQAFGERLPLAAKVVSAATAVPTQTPSPGVSFTVDRTEITAGECVVFSWKVENVQAVYFYAEGDDWQANGVAGEGRQQECLVQTTTYYLRVVYTDGSVEMQQITITVKPAAGAPDIRQFSVVPPRQVQAGQCVDISWDVRGDVDRVSIFANSTALWDGAPVSGNLEDCPPGVGTVNYRIEAVGPGGSSGQQQSINVVGGAPATATPEPTAAPSEPVIDFFNVQPGQIAVGECVAVSWSTSGGTTWVTILRDDAELEDNAPLSGTLEDCPQQAGDTVYAVVAYNAAEQRNKQELTVSVADVGPTNPLAGTSWAATFYYNPATNGMEQVLPGTSLTAVFGEGEDMSGSAGCNNYSASYGVDGNALRIRGLSASRSTCEVPLGIMDQEDNFLSNLQSADSYTLDGGQLYLSSGGTVTVEFVQR